MNCRIWFGNSDVVHEGDGLSTYAQQIVHVHGHAVNTNPTPLFELRSDLKFASHAVGGHGQQVVSEFDQPSKSAGQINGRPWGSGFSYAFAKRPDQ